ncbi:MAG: hypothetical protein NTU49_11300 [Gammaproteobacteria bacterium]|nr:hypothetical protein [Gammaproteobacteria bacterium]
MGIGSYIKNTAKGNTNVKGWSSWDAIKDNASIVKEFIAVPPAPDSETAVRSTFQEMVEKLGLSEKDIQASMKSHHRVSIVFLLLSLGAIGWMGVLLSKNFYVASIVSLSLAFLMGAYAFAEYFYYFKMKQRRLDCTVSDLISNLFSSKK